MKSSKLPPVVFLGPSAPLNEVLNEMPEALILHPVRRGDLYRYRVLGHSVFVIIDGVFSNTAAVSPREVIDVQADGAMVIGASSMGALRAADCAPVGVVGLGMIYRLYRRRLISSEDEVAVVYREDRPFPPMTESLANMRVALHRAVRRNLLRASDASKIIRLAEAEHYSSRTWQRVIECSEIKLKADAQAFLYSVDVKRSDARLAFRWLAHWSKRRGPFSSAKAVDLDWPLLTSKRRERSPDPLDGASEDAIIVDFVKWLILSGRIRAMKAWDPTFSVEEAERDVACGLTYERAVLLGKLLDHSANWNAALVRFNTFSKAISEAQRLSLTSEQKDVTSAELELAAAYGLAGWDQLIDKFNSQPHYCDLLKDYRDMIALTKFVKRKLFSREKIGRAFLWRRG